MTFLSFSEKIRFEKEDLVMIYRGMTANMQKFFAYIICDAKGLKKMREDYNAKNPAKLNQYGKVIYIDYAANPDDKAERFLSEFAQNYESLKEFI